MNQRGVILAVVAVGLVSAALWYWHGSGEPATPAKGTALQDAFHGPSTASAPIEPAPESDSAVKVDSAPAPVAAPPAVSAPPPEPPRSVDTPEPAQRKFARGSRPDESEQN